MESRQTSTCLFSELKKDKKAFCFKGIYVLVDADDEVIYIGSSYTRDIRKRLLQYQQDENSGNKTFISDLVNNNKTTRASAKKFILGLKIYCFEDESLEYKLINDTNGIVNSAGKRKNRK